MHSAAAAYQASAKEVGPVIASSIVDPTGDAHARLWHTWAVVFIRLIAGWWGFPAGPPQDFTEGSSL